MMRGAWGLTNRPYPAITGRPEITRQASGAQRVFRDAIDRGEFVFAPPLYRRGGILE